MTDSPVVRLRTRSVHGDYSVARMATGLPMYQDRSYTFTNLPDYLEGRTGIRTRNNDKHRPPIFALEVDAVDVTAAECAALCGPCAECEEPASKCSCANGEAPTCVDPTLCPECAECPECTECLSQHQFLCFELSREASVYILYDSTVTTPPPWLTDQFTLLDDHVWEQSDHGAECDDWLDRTWSWTRGEPKITDLDRSPGLSEGRAETSPHVPFWAYPETDGAGRSAMWNWDQPQLSHLGVGPDFAPVPHVSRCAELASVLPDGQSCAAGCNLHRAHGAPCMLDEVMDVNPRRCENDGCAAGVSPQCECEGTCPPSEPTCACEYSSGCRGPPFNAVADATVAANRHRVLRRDVRLLPRGRRGSERSAAAGG